MPSILGKEIGGTGYGMMSMSFSPFLLSLSYNTRKETDILTKSEKKKGLTWSPTPPPQPQSLSTLTTALSLGANFWNAGELYGTPSYNSLHLLKVYFDKYPDHADKILLSVKGGLRPGELVPDCSEENIRRSVEECVSILGGRKKIDVFECARLDPEVSIEEMVRVLGDLVREGKIGGVGLSEVDAETIRRAYVSILLLL